MISPQIHPESLKVLHYTNNWEVDQLNVHVQTDSTNLLFLDIFLSLLGDVVLMKTYVPTQTDNSCATVSRDTSVSLTSFYINQSPSATSTSSAAAVAGRDEVTALF